MHLRTSDLGFSKEHIVEYIQSIIKINFSDHFNSFCPATVNLGVISVMRSHPMMRIHPVIMRNRPVMRSHPLVMRMRSLAATNLTTVRSQVIAMNK